MLETFSLHVRQWFACLTISFITVMLIACNQPDNNNTHNFNDKINDDQVLKLGKHTDVKNTYQFGFDLRSSPQEDARQYIPFLEYLELETGYHFELRFTSESSSIIEELGNNRVQFAAIGATSFIEAQSKYQVLPMVRGKNLMGKAEYQSILVIRPDSKIRSLTDIKRKRLAFGSKTSTQGHLIPRIVLAEKGIELGDFRSVIYTDSHRNCAEAVISDLADICGMQDTMAKDMASQGLLKILHTSHYYPSSGIAANKNVPIEVLNKVKEALLAFDPMGKHRKNLYNWEKTEMPLGFSEAVEDDYLELRKWSIKLSFMDSPEHQLQK